MRIDYFVVSEKLKDRIVACEMHGKGIELQGASYSFREILLFFDSVCNSYLKLVVEI